MKNKFGFIPIVLPVLVMVLIIGLINMTGPQSTQAQTPELTLTFNAQDVSTRNDTYAGILSNADPNTPPVESVTRPFTFDRQSADLEEIKVNVLTRYIGVERAEFPQGLDVTEMTIAQIGLGQGDTGALVFRLDEGDNFLRIVAEHTGGSQSVRVIKIVRQSHDAPSFVDRTLEGQTRIFLAGVDIPDNAEIILPRATGGNGTLTYDLRGVRSGGDFGGFTVAQLPQGMSVGKR